MRVLPLTAQQITKLGNLRGPFSRPRIGRIMCDGKSVNVCTGHLLGGNVIDQMVYWGYPEQWFHAARQFLAENNPNKNFRITYNDKE